MEAWQSHSAAHSSVPPQHPPCPSKKDNSLGKASQSRSVCYRVKDHGMYPKKYYCHK